MKTVILRILKTRCHSAYLMAQPGPYRETLSQGGEGGGGTELSLYGEVSWPPGQERGCV